MKRVLFLALLLAGCQTTGPIATRIHAARRRCCSSKRELIRPLPPHALHGGG